MASTIVESSPELIHLFANISSKFSPAESENVVKSLKRIYGKQFDSLENQDLLSGLGLLYKLGYVSNTKLTLIREFVAPKSNKEEDICETLENFRMSYPPQADPERELQGRSDDFIKITEKLETGQPAVVNLHGSAGVGKTTLAKAISSEWGGKSYLFDLREAKDMKAVYFNMMTNLGLTVPVGYLSLSYVVDRIFEHCTVKEGDGQPVLFLLDNVEQFTLGQGKEGKNLRTAFMQFLVKLSEYDDSGKKRPLRVLLTSRTQLNDAEKVIDYELQPLKDSDSEKILLPEEMPDMNSEQREKLVAFCHGKPLFLKGTGSILRQKRKAPDDLIDDLEILIHMVTKDKADFPLNSELEEDSREELFDLEQGVEESVMKEMFNTLPSDSLKESAVSISLFCGPFTVSTAAKVLDISPTEAVAQLEGLETSAIVFVVNRRAKELMYDIHPLLRKYADSIKSDGKFAESYSKARARFYEHFMSEMKRIAGFVESDYIEAFTCFASDQPNYEFAISLLPEFFSVPCEFHDIALIASLVHAMLSCEKQRELFHTWAGMCQDDAKSGSLFRAQLRCWEARQVLDVSGPLQAFEVLQQAALSLEKVEDQTTESFKLTRGLYRYFEGEIYYQMKDYRKALECLQSSLDLTEELLKVHTNLARCYNAMGNCYYGLYKPEKALEFYTKALKMREELSGSEYHFDMPVYKNQIGTVYEDQGEYEKAVECYKDAIRLLEELNISGYENEALFCRNLANALLRQEKFREAIMPAHKAYNIRSKLLRSHPDTVRSIFQLGAIRAHLREFKKALDLFLKAWEMEKSLDPGNHSAVWKLIIKGVNDMLNFLLDEFAQGKEKETIRNERETFRRDVLAFCKCFWKEEKEVSQFGFTEYNKGIIDTIMELLGDDERNRDARDEYEKEALWFYDGFQRATEDDFCKDFDKETDIKNLNVMLDERLEFLQKIVELCIRLDQHEKRAEHERKKLALCRIALLKAETKEVMVARKGTIKDILQISQELKKEKLGRQYGKEALRFYEDLWTAQYAEMNVPTMKKCLDEMKDLASSVGDRDRVKLYQDALQNMIKIGKKPGPTLTPKESQAPSSKERSNSTHESDSDEDKVIAVGSKQEAEVTSQQEIEMDVEHEVKKGSKEEREVEEVFEEEIQTTSEVKHGVGGVFSGVDNSSTIIDRSKVTEEGVNLHLEEASACITFHPGAVTQPTLITCSLWSPRSLSPPLQGNEALVSNVIELSLDNPPDLESTGDAKEGITVALLHSACELKGYELVIKQLVDPDTEEWKDLKTQSIWRSSGSPNWLINFAEASCPVTRYSCFAVIWRLKSFQFSKHTSVGPEFTCILPDYPDISVTIPSSSVPATEDFCLTIKVHEFRSREVEKGRLLLGPVLHISCSPNITLSEAAIIKIPLSLHEGKRLLDTDLSSGHLRILHYSSAKEESPTWTEITDTLETKATVTDGIVTFQVKHFCREVNFEDCFSVRVSLKIKNVSCARMVLAFNVISKYFGRPFDLLGSEELTKISVHNNKYE